MLMTLEQIRLDVADLSPYDPYLSSSQPLLSPISPRPSECDLGWRDRWWLHQTCAQNLSLNYWYFTSLTEAIRVGEESRNRLSARQRFINGVRQSVYQPVPDLLMADRVWRTEQNILLIRENVLALVAESGRQIEIETTLAIANRILAKIEAQLAIDS
jgi:hypothetical protein|tara:strand:- start:294 stop:767 length:474 start_codon:yes stop_codon:yes gene_type:complete